ncbi:MAG: hypothetical protein K0B81_00485 [Candidatus Cloacimonetes bacterium]|nr:hypothetical protein [Candidatus Cloacimonadota bacterium]
MKARYILSFLLIIILTGCSGPQLSYNEYTNIDTTYPQQEKLTEPDVMIITRGNSSFTLHPKAHYRVGAVVRSKRGYRFDAMSKISPYDFALVWGVLADKHFYQQVRISQGRRRYFFKPKRSSHLSLDWVYVNSSNHHVIPANVNIKRALRRVKKNDIIELEGYLVDIHAVIKGRTHTWNTSLTRDDRGDGSCEIMYVRKVKINYNVYE